MRFTNHDRFDDCLRLRRRIDERPYLLPDPEILKKGPEDDVKIPNSQHLEGAVTATPNYIAPPADEPTLNLSVFEDRTYMLSQDLNLSNKLRGILETLIKNGGGSTTTNVEKADTLICHYRDGKDYISASQAGKDVGNLSWLYHLITQNEFTSPFRRLMHYPVPRHGIPGFKNLRITLSNYGGEARIYLENLVVACGAEFTKSMKQDNTHLITARMASEKCKAAQEWGIEMINHLWIEESYAKCAMQPLSTRKYTHFPPRTNLGEVIGQTQFDTAALESIYYPAEDEDEPNSPDTVKQPRPAMVKKDSNILPEPDSSRLTSPTSDPPSPGITPAKPKMKRTSTPQMSRLMDKENDTPSSTSSRGAKDRAISRLSDIAPDIALYEKEKKRAGSSTIFGGKRAADQLEREREEKKAAKKKRLSSPPPPEDDESAESEHEAKRQKIIKPTLPDIDMRLLITSYAKWINKPAQEDADRVRTFVHLYTSLPTMSSKTT